MTQLTKTFAALADETRFSLVEHLLQHGEASAGELVGLTHISAPAVSRHLKVLREAGVVTRRSQGQTRVYAINPESVSRIASWTMDHREFWETSLDRLGAAIEAKQNKDGGTDG